MRTRSSHLVFLLVLGVVCLAASASAETGSITGRITDRETGDPVIGASVQLQATALGARTDADGRYQILRVPEGTYALVITSVEYMTVLIPKVEVVAGEATVQDQTLTHKVTDLEKSIDVTAQARVIDRFAGANLVQPGAIKTKPVQNVEALLEQVAGVQTTTTGEVFIRGGRAGDVSYIVDGVEIGDPLGGTGSTGARLNLSDGSIYPPAHGGTEIVNGEPYDAMFFKHAGVNPFVDTEDDHYSTFAIDVDDASYSMTRSYLQRGFLPPTEAVRVEEFVNHFTYGYEPPGSETFRVNMEAAPAPFGPRGSLLFRIGIKGREILDIDRTPANLVFVVDISGSMARENRLGLVRRALEMLTRGLRPDDSLAIVVYGNAAETRLNPTAIRNRARILPVIRALTPKGATNAEAGIKLGYRLADRMFDRNRINRVILCSDGVANVGQTGPDAILNEIDRYRKQGIQLTAVGFGMGNYNDVLMEKLGNRGDGQYAYIDTFEEAKSLFEDKLTGTLESIARDVKIQVDFNPDVVRSYRLLGYENREVADDKFRDDNEDGGEIGAGHMVTALYEIKLQEQPKSHLIATLFMRWKNADGDRVTETNYPFVTDGVSRQFESTGDDFQLAAAAAEFAEILRDSYWAKDGSLDQVLTIARRMEQRNASEEVIELVDLVERAAEHGEELASR